MSYLISWAIVKIEFKILMSSKECWHNIGIEFEYTDIIPSTIPDISNLVDNMGMMITHDASVESPSEFFILDNKPISGRTLNCVLNRAIIKKATIGGELVSSILNTKDPNWIIPWDKLFGLLKQNGERENSNRGSIHIHVDMIREHENDNRFTIGMLRRLWMLAGFFEAAFFKIGAFGRPHRGSKMDYIYYRPIVSSGPPIIRDGNMGYRPLLNYDDVMDSKNSLEFFIKCGDIYNAEGRYHPCRYMWINFFNMRADRPHLEFRVFNKTMRWDYLYTVVELCKAFVSTAYNRTTEEIRDLVNQRAIGIANPPTDKFDFLYFTDLIEFLQITDELVISKLEQIWSESNYPEYVDDKIYSHLVERTRCFYTPETMEIAPEALNADEVIKVRTPQYIDIHTLQRMNETIFPEALRA